MAKPITIEIDLNRIDRRFLRTVQKRDGSTAVYCKFVAHPRTQPSRIERDTSTHFVAQDNFDPKIPRDQREKMPIIGGLEIPDTAAPPARPAAQTPQASKGPPKVAGGGNTMDWGKP